MKGLLVCMSVIMTSLFALPLIADDTGVDNAEEVTEDVSEEAPDFLLLCEKGSAEEVQEAIQAGAAVNEKREDGYSPLIIALELNKNDDVINVLLRSGASVKERDPNGMTVLMIALQYKQNPELIRSLLKLGSSVKERGPDGITPLMVAAQYTKSDEILSILLKAGASVKDRNKYEETPLLIAARYTENPSIIDALVKAGSSVKEKDTWESTPLILAVRYNLNANVVSSLLRAGSSVNERVSSLYMKFENEIVGSGVKSMKNNKGWTPLMIAAGCNSNVEIVNMLIKHGANVNERFSFVVDTDMSLVNMMIDSFKDENENLSVLMFAARNNCPEVVTALLKAGADPKAKNKKGQTAFDLAEENSLLKNTPAYWALQDAQYKKQ